MVVARGAHPDSVRLRQQSVAVLVVTVGRTRIALARLNLTSPSLARLESGARHLRPSLARSSPTTLARLSGYTPHGYRSVEYGGDMSVLVRVCAGEANQAVRRDGSPAAGLAPPVRAGGETGASTRTASREASCESPARRQSWRGHRTQVRRTGGRAGIETIGTLGRLNAGPS